MKSLVTAAALLGAFVLPAAAQPAAPAVRYADALLQSAPPADPAELVIASHILQASGQPREARAALRLAERMVLVQVRGSAPSLASPLARAIEAEGARENEAAALLDALRDEVLAKSLTLLPAEAPAALERSFRNEAPAPVRAAKAVVMREGGLFLQCERAPSADAAPIPRGGTGTFRCERLAEEQAWGLLQTELGGSRRIDRDATTFRVTRIEFAQPPFIVESTAVYPARDLAAEARSRIAAGALPQAAPPATAPITLPPAPRAVRLESPLVQSLLTAPVTADTEALRLQSAIFAVGGHEAHAKAVEAIAAHLFLHQAVRLPAPSLPPTLGDAIEAQRTGPANLASARSTVLERSIAPLQDAPLAGAAGTGRLPFRNDSAFALWSFSGAIDAGAKGRWECAYGGIGIPPVVPGDGAQADCKGPAGAANPGSGEPQREGPARFRAERITFVPGNFRVDAAHAGFTLDRKADALQHLSGLDERELLRPGEPTIAQVESELDRRFAMIAIALVVLGLVVGMAIGTWSPRPGVGFVVAMFAFGALAFGTAIRYGLPWVTGHNPGNLEGQIGFLIGGGVFAIQLAIAGLVSLAFGFGLLVGVVAGMHVRRRSRG